MPPRPTLRLNDPAGRVVLMFYGIGTSMVAILNLERMLVPWNMSTTRPAGSLSRNVEVMSEFMCPPSHWVATT